MIKIALREFTGSLVVRIPGFPYCGLGSVPGWRTEILQAMQPGEEIFKNHIDISIMFVTMFTM